MRVYRYFILICFLLLGIAGNLYSWGFDAHKKITRNATQVVAQEIQPFFAHFGDSLASRSVEPDAYRENHPEEGPNHYIDIDHYGQYPFAELPQDYSAAVEKFGEETLHEYGVIPWRVDECTDSLIVAMQAQNTKKIIRWAAWLAHYVADFHQPLHTVLNYDGQLTGNNGIHSRYEAGMLRIYLDEYTFNQRGVNPVNDPLATAFAIVRESNLLNPQIITADNYATQPMEEHEVIKLQDYWDLKRDGAYFERFFSQTSEMTWQRLALASSRLAEYWNYAWRQAGKPALTLAK